MEYKIKIADTMLFCERCGRSIPFSAEYVKYKNNDYHKSCFIKEFTISKLTSFRLDVETDKINSKEAILTLIDIISDYINFDDRRER